MKKGLFMICIMIFSVHLFADAIDDYVKVEIEKRKIPGVSIAILKDGQIVKTAGYGFSNLEHMVPAKPETIYQSGSVGKQFTATGVMMLVEEGKVSLDDRIPKYFPEGKGVWKDVTVRHLLSHTAGISNKLYDQIDMRKDYTEEEMVQKIASMPLDFAPGEKWNYSNPGYVLLGSLIRRVTGKFYGDFLKERIFDPIGMTTTRIINEADIIPNRAAGYVLEKDTLKNQEWVSPMINTTADGSLYFTVLDLAKWDAALYSEKLLKKSSLEQMWTPIKLNDGKTHAYGFGWGFDSIRGHKIIEHGGAWQGFNTHIVRYVDDRITVVVLANRASANPDSIAHHVAGLENSELTPIEPKEAKIDPKILDAYTGKYQLQEGVVLTVTKKDDKLMGQVQDQSEFQMLPESETSFFVKDSELQLTFVKDAQGKVTHLLLPKMEIEAKKIQ